jgi:type I restriction enzyme S subunit
MKWHTSTIGEVCEIVSGATPKTGNPSFWNGNIHWVTPKDLSVLQQKKYLEDTPRKITKDGLRSCSAKMLPPQSVLFSTRAPIGLVAINTIPVCTNQGLKSMVPRGDLLSADYLFWWLKIHKEEIERSGRGAIFKEVSKKIVEDIAIPLPPLAEQKRIAAILDAADALRAKRRETLAQLDTLLQSTFLDMFGDPVTNPMGWEVCTLKDTKSKIQIGPFGSLLHKEDYISGGIPLINPMHIVFSKIQTANDQSVSEEKAASLAMYRLKNGDVIHGQAW